MTQKHTPWNVGSCQWPVQIGCCPLVGRPYSIHGTDNRNVAAAVSEEIARLIAAAPDMLEALRAFVDGPDWISADDCVKRDIAARAAIARATGAA